MLSSAKMTTTAFLLLMLLWARAFPTQQPAALPFVTVDINQGEHVSVALQDGTVVAVELLGRTEVCDSLREAVRQATVRLRVNGVQNVLECANYSLPKTVGSVRIDCEITRGYLTNSRANPWALEKDARLRLWPADSSFLPAGTYRYPVRQRWFATDTQMANQPSYVDGSEEPAAKRIYYHHGLDIGGAEGLTEVVSATDGRVIVRGRESLPEYASSPYTEVNYDGAIVLDDRGWYHWYFHLFSIDPGVKLGHRIRSGEPIGRIGKEGSAGCWSHLHYEIRGPVPSGRAGIVEGYGFLWEAYRREYDPPVIAVARPHSFVRVGEPARLDGSLSWARSGIARYDWTFSDGGTMSGPVVSRKYGRPGTYSETLRVADRSGEFAYDFAVVQVVQDPSTKPGAGDQLPPTIHASFWPTLDIHAGQPVTFLVRTCRTTSGHERWDFGDGTPLAFVRSDGCASEKAKDGYAKVSHAFQRPGDYLVKVERANERGETATARLWVRVGK